MGNCFTSDEENSKNNLFPDFFYLFRDKKYLLRISNDMISKYKFENPIKIRKDSGVGYLNDGRIIVAGGTDSSGCLTNRAYIINPANCQVLSVDNLPVSAKEGAFFHYKTFVYYVGAIKEAEDEDLLVQEQTAPIMKYSVEEGYWEIFNHKKSDNKMGFQDYLKKKLKEGDDDDDENVEVSLREVMYAGMFMLGSKIYFINGQRMSSRGILKSMKAVFSIDLEEDDFNFQQEPFSSPKKIFRPICGSYGDKAFITGGLKPSSKSCNMDSFIFSLNDDKGNFEHVPGLKLALDDTYPIISTNRAHIAISYPNVAIYEIKSNSWLMFTFGENLINRNLVKYTTPVLETAQFVSGQVIKREGQFSVKFKTNDKLNDSDNLESGMSLSEPERIDKATIKLPEGLILNTEFSPESSISNKRLNISNSSDDFSVEQKLDIPMVKQSHSHLSSKSSVNLSDRSYAKKSNRKLAPMALPAKNFKLKQDLGFGSRNSIDSSEGFNLHDYHKKQEIDSDLEEPEEVSDRSSRKIKKNQFEDDSESSDFEINGGYKEPVKSQAVLIAENLKGLHIDHESSSSSEHKFWNKKHSRKSSSSFGMKDSEKQTPRVNINNNLDDSKLDSSSDFDFNIEIVKKTPVHIKDQLESSSESKFSLDDSREKAVMHNLIDDHSEQDPNTKNLPYKSPVAYPKDIKQDKRDSSVEDSKKIKDLSESKNLIPESSDLEPDDDIEDKPPTIASLANKDHKKTYTGGLGLVIPVVAKKNKLDSIEDEDFGYESPKKLEVPKISDQISSRKASPVKPKAPIVMKKVASKAEIEGSANLEKLSKKKEKIEKKKSYSDSDEELKEIKKSKTRYTKKQIPKKMESSSSESFNEPVELEIPEKLKDDDSNNEKFIDRSQSLHRKSQSDSERKSIISIEEPIEEGNELAYQLKIERVSPLIDLILKELEIVNMKNSGITKILNRYKRPIINNSNLEEILSKLLPDKAFRVTLLSNLLRKIHTVLEKKKISHENLLRIYNSADITEDTITIERNVICYCISKGINAIY